MAIFNITGIKWDTDGETVALPTEVQIELGEEALDNEDIEDQLSEILTDVVGFCHFGFSYSVS